VSRFADPEARRTVELGPCECPGAPHDSDWAKVRSELAPADIRRAVALTTLDDDAAIAAGLVEFVAEWNLLAPNGRLWPPSAESIVSLKGPTLIALIGGLTDSIRESSNVPNAPSVPSRASRRGNASRTPKTTPIPGT
jgi:hypothetical protein